MVICLERGAADNRPSSSYLLVLCTKKKENHLEVDLCIYDCDKVIVLLSSYPNEFMSGKNNSIVVQDALFNFILNSNKNVKK